MTRAQRQTLYLLLPRVVRRGKRYCVKLFAWRSSEGGIYSVDVDDVEDGSFDFYCHSAYNYGVHTYTTKFYTATSSSLCSNSNVPANTQIVRISVPWLRVWNFKN